MTNPTARIDDDPHRRSSSRPVDALVTVTTDAERFLTVHWERLVGVLTIRTSDPALAEELAQETMARVWSRWDTVSTAQDPVAWMYRVAFNLVNSHWRRSRVRRRAAERRTVDGAPLQLLTEDALAVRAALASLSERQRQVLVLRYFVDLDVSATAAVLGVSESTVTTQTARALQRLRRELDDVG